MANDMVADKKQRAIFLTSRGVMTYNLVHSLVAPKKLPELTFANTYEAANRALSS